MIVNVRTKGYEWTEGSPRYRAFLDGEEVTRNCWYANEEEGVVGLYATDGNGRWFVNPLTGKLADEFRKGKVQIKPIQPTVPDEPGFLTTAVEDSNV